MAYVVLLTSKKLRLYFEAHIIEVRSNYPLKKLLHRNDITYQLTEWSVQLGAYDIRYTTRQALKAQALADFIVEFTPIILVEIEKKEQWKACSASDSNGSLVGILLYVPYLIKLRYARKLKLNTTNIME